MHSIIDPNTGKIWDVKDEVALDEEDQSLFTSAKIVSSEFGKTLCLFLKKAGPPQYFPLSFDGEQPAIGDTVPLDQITMQVLSRKGEKGLLRAKVNKK